MGPQMAYGSSHMDEEDEVKELKYIKSIMRYGYGINILRLKTKDMAAAKRFVQTIYRRYPTGEHRHNQNWLMENAVWTRKLK